MQNGKCTDFAIDFGIDFGKQTIRYFRIVTIKQDPHITAAEIAMQLNMSSRGVEKQIRKLRELGKIKRTGGRFGGYLEIVILDKE